MSAAVRLVDLLVVTLSAVAVAIAVVIAFCHRHSMPFAPLPRMTWSHCRKRREEAKKYLQAQKRLRQVSAVAEAVKQEQARQSRLAALSELKERTKQPLLKDSAAVSLAGATSGGARHRTKSRSLSRTSGSHQPRCVAVSAVRSLWACSS